MIDDWLVHVFTKKTDYLVTRDDLKNIDTTLVEFFFENRFDISEVCIDWELK